MCALVLGYSPHLCFQSFQDLLSLFPATAYGSITFVAVAPSLVWNNRRNAGAAIEFAASARKLAPPTRRYSFKTLWTMACDTKPFSRIGRIDLDMFFNVFCLCMAGFLQQNVLQSRRFFVGVFTVFFRHRTRV